MEITIDIQGGILRAIYSDELASLLTTGDAVTIRASHVEPAPDGTWYADMSPSGGPVINGCSSRGTALQSEMAWLKENRNL